MALIACKHSIFNLSKLVYFCFLMLTLNMRENKQHFWHIVLFKNLECPFSIGSTRQIWLQSNQQNNDGRGSIEIYPIMGIMIITQNKVYWKYANQAVEMICNKLVSFMHLLHKLKKIKNKNSRSYFFHFFLKKVEIK